METLDIQHPNRQKRLKWYIKTMKPVAYWPLWEREGAVARNYAPDNIGSLDGTISNATTGQRGQAGPTFEFNGTSTKVQISDNALLEGWSAYTILFMMNADDTDTGVVIDKNRFGAWNVHFIGGNTLRYEGAPGTTDSGTDAGANEWFICAYRNTGSAQDWCINGVVSGTPTSHSGGAGTGDDDVRIGAFHDDSGWFDGRMQHFAIYDKVLSTPQLLKMATIAGLA